ncbi:hypothetical protein GCM10029992_14820 [Glycomyces albus]
MTREEWNPRPGPRPDGGLAVAAVLLLLSGAWQVFIGFSIATGESAAFSGDGYWHRADGAGWGGSICSWAWPRSPRRSC